MLPLLLRAQGFQPAGREAGTELSYVPFLSPLGRAENREKYPSEAARAQRPGLEPPKDSDPSEKV